MALQVEIDREAQMGRESSAMRARLLLSSQFQSVYNPFGCSPVVIDD
jgi:hypothetical protein